MRSGVSCKTRAIITTPARPSFCNLFSIPEDPDHRTVANAMRHGCRSNRLSRAADQRKALIRSLVTEVLTHGRIRTTVVRAKYLRKHVDKIISLSKIGSLHGRRQLEA